MFGPPPYPPKDYIIRSVPKIQRSSPEFTPDSLPRVTQTNFGQFCYPIQYQDGEAPEKIENVPVNPLVMEKWTKDARALWVDKPGKDGFLIHDVFKNYSVTVDTYDPRYKHKEKVFNRSYKYELVCLEENRLQKLRDKCEKEVGEAEKTYQELIDKAYARLHPPMKVKGCKEEPPFWWKTTADVACSTTEQKLIENPQATREMEYEKFERGRWAPEPSLTATVIDDPCRRKYDMLIVGQPFRSEACNFYYYNYPPPDLKFIKKKFA